MLRHRHAILVARRDGLQERDIPTGSTSVVVNHWEGVAQLARSGKVDLPTLYANYGNVCRAWWLLLESRIRWWRSAQSDPQDAENFEWLAGAFEKLDHDRGVAALSAQAVMAGLDVRIEDLEGRIAVEEALRMVAIAPRDPAPTAGQRPANPSSATGGRPRPSRQRPVANAPS